MLRFKKTGAKRGLYASVQKNRCQKRVICFGSIDPKPKMWLDISKMPLPITSLASGVTELGPNSAICLSY